MQQPGIVVQTEKNRVLVAVGRQSACGGQCSSCSGCHARRHTVWLDAPMPLHVGDVVQLSASDSAVLRAAVLVYGLPLALFLIVCCLVCQITGNTLQTALAALGSLALGALLIKALDARFAPPLTITKATTRG